MKKLSILFLFVICYISAFSANAINQKQLTDSLRSYAAEHAVLESRIRIKGIKLSGSTLRIETNPSLSCLPFTPQMVREIKNMVRRIGNVPADTKVKIYTDGYEIEQLIGNYYLPENKQRDPYTIRDTQKPLVKYTSLPYSAPAGLENKYIALWASHGRFFDEKENRWRWQRAALFETAEDVLTSSFTMPFLVPMLENAGAIVIQPRERDTQVNEVVIEGTEASGDDTKAYFLPRIPQAGNYAVYAWWEQGDDRSDEVTYTIMHDGQETPINVNQRMGGHTWIYLGTFYFREGTDEDNGVCVIGLGTKRTRRLKTCRMKFGGGMGSIARSIDSTHKATVSGLPRWMEGSRYWLEYAGIPDSVYSQTKGKSDYTDDFTCRGRWLNYLCGGSPANPNGPGLKIPVNLGLAFHTDAGTCNGDTTVGTLVIYTDHNNDNHYKTPTGHSRLTFRDYAQRVQTQVVEDIRAVYAPEWNRRELRNASYSETRNPEVPTIILEILAHQNIADMRYGHDPRFKFLVSRAVYKGILKYLADQYDYKYVVQPLPVNSFAIERVGKDSVRLSWLPTNDRLESTATPTYYVVYQQIEGREWSRGIKTTHTHITLPISKGLLTAYRVAAGNAGGISLPSETLAAYINKQEKGTALVVNAFTRLCAPEYVCYRDSMDGFDPKTFGIAYGKDISFLGKQYEFRREMKWRSDDDPGFGATLHNFTSTLEIGNTFDYPVVHGRAISEAGYSFVSQSSAYIIKKGIDPAYNFVDIIFGKQRTTMLGTEKQTVDFKVMPKEIRRAISSYTSKGGNLLISGSYIGSDMQTDNVERQFVENTLHYELLSPAASQECVISTGYLDINEYSLLNEPNELRIPTEEPDALLPKGKGAHTIGNYTDTGLSAGVAYEGDYKCVSLGFPIESLQTQEQINQIIKSIISFFEF